ncbi:MAG: hypothetical protein U0132_09895 [Gemmatimonadaceae bacterium]
MNATRWDAVCATFDDLVDLDASEQTVQLAALAETDPELQRDVQRPLNADAHAASRLAALLSPLGLAPPEGAESSSATSSDA